MALWFGDHRAVQRGVQKIVACAFTQSRAEVDAVVLAEAHIHLTGAGDAHAVACFAEIVAERCDETEAPAGFSDANVTRRPAGAQRQILKRPETFQILADRAQ